MAIRIEEKNGMSLLHVEGEMTIYTAAELKSQLLLHLPPQGALEIDLSQVSEIDGAGLQLLILAKRKTQLAGQTLLLTAHSRAVQEAFELCNLAAFFGDPLVLTQAVNY